MADYYSPTVIEPNIPLADMTPLEQLLLTQIFDAETIDESLYFFEEQSPHDQLWLDVDEVRDALVRSEGIASKTTEIVTDGLAKLAPGAEDLEIDLSMASWEFIFQDIIRRSGTIPHVVVTTSFTCSRMRPDGFGGMITVITADEMLSSSTSDMLAVFLDRVDYGDLACPPGFGNHVALQLAEADVSQAVREILDTERPPGTAADDVTADDIRTACTAIIEQHDFSHEHGALSVAAAQHAIRAVIERNHHSEIQMS